jgi:serine/threonine-protein kinase
MSETVALPTGLPRHIQPGLVIGGKYRLEQEIGRGSMGTVYRAVHVTLGQRVAIKLISGAHSPSAEARQRFSVEAKAAAKLRSRHVVQVIDDGATPQGDPYIVLEFLDGETLEQRVAREHDLPLRDAVRVITHVGRALARAHAEGIVHRDLKPANIFLAKSDDDDDGWVAKVLDFGVAKLAQEAGTTRAGTVLGTPLFMSPEQVRGASNVDHRADLYSLGMCLFHVLTGEYAYYAASYSDILVAICAQPLPRLHEKAPWLPAAVEQWFQRACAREPLDRFQSADEMTEALRAAAGGLTPLSKHESVPEGRIAPETLVGFAAPALTTLQLDTAPLSLARTQALPQPPSQTDVRAPPATPIVIANHRSDGAPFASGWRPPKRNLRPLLLGVGLGLLAVASVATTLLLLGGRSREPKPGAEASAKAAVSARAVAPSSEPTAPPFSGPARAEPPAVTTGSVSSVAAEVLSPARRRSPPSGGSAKKSAPAPATSSRGASPLGAPAGSSVGADLGF